MAENKRTSWLADCFWLLGFGLVSSIWCLAAGRTIGPTFDEPFYISKGLEYWRTGSHRELVRVGTMPLPVDWQTLPLYLGEVWQGREWDAHDELEDMLPWARAATLAFWWLLLGYAWLIGRNLAGVWGGRLAVSLAALEPCLLAHASLATTDIAITACMLGLTYHFRQGRDGGWLKRIGVPGFWFGAAILAKASGLVFGPLCMAVIECERLLRKGSPRPLTLSARWGTQIKPFLRDSLQIVTLGMVLMFVYCGSDWQPQSSFVIWSHTLSEGPFKETMVWLAENLCIFSNAGEGLVRQIKHNLQGHSVYILGQTDYRKIWWYFPVALSIKLSLTLLVLPWLVGVVRPRALLNWACLAAGILLLYSVQCRVQIGIRLMLPLVGLACAGLGAAAVNAWESMTPGWNKQALATAVSLGLIWTGLAAVRVWPHGLCYVNEIWGDSRNGYLLLSDSNHDWGQGLKELARWQKKNQAEKMDLWYFGADPAQGKLPIRNLPIQEFQSPQDFLAQVRGRYFAVSTTLLYGSYIPAQGKVVEYLRSLQPVGRTQTFLIYDFRRS